MPEGESGLPVEGAILFLLGVLLLWRLVVGFNEGRVPFIIFYKRIIGWKFRYLEIERLNSPVSFWVVFILSVLSAVSVSGLGILILMT